MTSDDAATDAAEQVLESLLKLSENLSEITSRRNLGTLAVLVSESVSLSLNYSIFSLLIHILL